MITLKNKRRGGGGVNGNIESESEEREWNGTRNGTVFQSERNDGTRSFQKVERPIPRVQ